MKESGKNEEKSSVAEIFQCILSVLFGCALSFGFTRYCCCRKPKVIKSGSSENDRLLDDIPAGGADNAGGRVGVVDNVVFEKIPKNDESVKIAVKNDLKKEFEYSQSLKKKPE